MKDTLEINEFLKHFNYTSYNREQIGYDKKTILDIYKFLKKLNISEDLISSLLKNIAYYKAKDINIPLFLEILSRTIGFLDLYELSELIKVVKEVHNIYYANSREISLEEYIHDTEENRIKKIFLDRNNKYIIKDFNDDNPFINDLKFAAALILDSKEYKEFLCYIDDFTTNKNHYSPLTTFKTYSKLREHLKGNAKLFWDIYYGNEYIVALNKDGLKPDIFIENKNIIEKPVKEELKPIQLDLFTYQDYVEDEFKLPEDFKLFQISYLYSNATLSEIDSEKELLAYYNKVLNSKEVINLPKLKNQSNPGYVFEIN